MGRGVHAASKPVIAVVDDDLAVRNSLAFALGGDGFAIRTYRSAEELLDDAHLADTNCFIVDYKLPGLNGLDLVKELRRRDVVAPAILITTGPSAHTRRNAAAEHMVIVEKPLLGEALFHEVHAALAAMRVAPDPAKPDRH